MGSRAKSSREPQLAVADVAAAAASPPLLFPFDAWHGQGETGVDTGRANLAVWLSAEALHGENLAVSTRVGGDCLSVVVQPLDLEPTRCLGHLSQHQLGC